MRVDQLRKDIKEISHPLLSGFGFTQVGKFGERVKTEESNNLFAVLMEESKDSGVFSVSVRVFVRYESIESIFEEADPDSKYTINKLLATESISFDDYCTEKLELALNRLIGSEAMSFFDGYGSYAAIVSNLTKNDYRDWITSDKVAQFKVRLGSAALENDSKALAEAKKEASKFCEKPWSEASRDVIRRLCEAV